jgi:hypothetical protein
VLDISLRGKLKAFVLDISLFLRGKLKAFVLDISRGFPQNYI